jgi:photosystem II stability/assembly factor-like uncharacterized protein
MKKLFTHDSLNTRNTLSTLLFYLAILIFLIGFNFTDTPPPFGWYQQFMPNLNGQPISDIFFIDSLTGWAVTNDNTPQDTGYVLKTTNAGDNWTIKFQDKRDFSRIKFINNNTGFTCGGTGSGTSYFYKSTNGGDNWFTLSVLGNNFYTDMSVLNNDTIWLVDPDALIGGVFLTTNGGANWTQQAAFGINNPSHIYMFNSRLGFIDAGGLRRTSDGGNNWTPITGAGNFLDMYIVDSLTGWKCNLDMKKTTDGGLNWMPEVLPSGGNILLNGMIKFSNVNKDTIWGVGGNLFYGSGQFRGIIFKTTDNGLNWLFQIPDTTIHIVQYVYIKFINKLNGWAYSNGPGVHTVIGGDTVWYTGIVQQSREVPNNFILKQNYPNPFNPRTVIPYSLKSAGYVRIIAYDILGREVQKLVDQKQSAGEYEVDFMGKFCSSGVYFYRMTVDDRIIDTKRMLMLK